MGECGTLHRALGARGGAKGVLTRTFKNERRVWGGAGDLKGGYLHHCGIVSKKDGCLGGNEGQKHFRG